MSFYISFNCWFFSRVRVTASRFRSPGLQSLLADLISVIIWLILILSLNFNPPPPPYTFQSFEDCSKGTNYTITLMFHSYFSSSARSKYLSSFCFLLFSFCGQLERQNPRGDTFFSCQLTLGLVFWSKFWTIQILTIFNKMLLREI